MSDSAKNLDDIDLPEEDEFEATAVGVEAPAPAPADDAEGEVLDFPSGGGTKKLSVADSDAEEGPTATGVVPSGEESSEPTATGVMPGGESTAELEKPAEKEIVAAPEESADSGKEDGEGEGEEDEVDEDELSFTMVGGDFGDELDDGEEQVGVTPRDKRAVLVHDENGPLRSQAVIRELRKERDGLLREIKHLRTENRLSEGERLGLVAELEDGKIEVSVLKKRHRQEMDEMKYRIRLAEERKLVAEEKMKKLQGEFDRLEGRVRVDLDQVRRKERELASKIEFITLDSESQVKSREKKILELTRKIDQLEFNMENATIRDKKMRDEKLQLEERIDRIMKTLRGSIELFEDDSVPRAEIAGKVENS